MYLIRSSYITLKQEFTTPYMHQTIEINIGVGPCWLIGRSLGTLEEGIKWLDDGGTVWDKSSIKLINPMNSSSLH